MVGLERLKVDQLEITQIALAGLMGLGGWFAVGLYSRLVKALDATVEKLGHVGETQAAHSARLDALERGQ